MEVRELQVVQWDAGLLKKAFLPLTYTPLLLTKEAVEEYSFRKEGRRRRMQSSQGNGEGGQVGEKTLLALS